MKNIEIIETFLAEAILTQPIGYRHDLHQLAIGLDKRLARNRIIERSWFWPLAFAAISIVILRYAGTI